jgi:predicted nucleic acid-binding protein
MKQEHKGIILDANILIRAVLGSRVRGLIELYADRVRFFTPELCVAEAQRHLPSLYLRG